MNCESPLDKMSRGMIHNKHRRMDHRLSVPLSTQPLGAIAILLVGDVAILQHRRPPKIVYLDPRLKILVQVIVYL